MAGSMLPRSRELDYWGGGKTKKYLLWLLVSVAVGLWRQCTVLDGEEHSGEKGDHLLVSGKHHLLQRPHPPIHSDLTSFSGDQSLTLHVFEGQTCFNLKHSEKIQPTVGGLR